MRLVLVLAMRVASYWCVAPLKPVHARVVNGTPFNAPSIFSSTKSPPNSGRIVDVPLVVTPGPPGRNQNVISTSQVPLIAVSRACSGSAPGIFDGAGGAAPAVVAAAIAPTVTSAAIKQARTRCIVRSFIGRPAAGSMRRSYLGALAGDADERFELAKRAGRSPQQHLGPEQSRDRARPRRLRRQPPDGASGRSSGE